MGSSNIVNWCPPPVPQRKGERKRKRRPPDNSSATQKNKKSPLSYFFSLVWFFSPSLHRRQKTCPESLVFSQPHRNPAAVDLHSFYPVQYLSLLNQADGPARMQEGAGSLIVHAVVVIHIDQKTSHQGACCSDEQLVTRGFRR